MANNYTYCAANLFLIFAAVLGIVSFLCGWVVYNVGDGFFAAWTGYGILDSEPQKVLGGVAFVPLFILILSVLALIVAFLPKMGLNVSAPKYSVMLLILGFAILILTIIFTISNGTYEDGTKFRIWEQLGVGVWFTYISSILLIFIGALPGLTRKV